jgi:hypothetical protein
VTASNVARLPAPEPKPERKPKKKPSVAAREAEADDGYVTVEQCGVKLKFPVGGKISLKAFIAFSEGDNIKGTQLLLGPEQWNAFLEKDPTLEDFEAIGNQLQESAGN